MNRRNILLYLVIIATAVASRLIPHAWNFAPVTAVGIVAAVYLPKRVAFALPLVVRLVSDTFIGFFSWPLMVAVYTSHVFGVFAGLWIRRNKRMGRIIIASLASSVVFFLVTNFAFLYPNYPHNLQGVWQSYVNGLPFFRGTLLGDLFYTLGLIYGYEAVLFWKEKKSFKPEVI